VAYFFSIFPLARPSRSLATLRLLTAGVLASTVISLYIIVLIVEGLRIHAAFQVEEFDFPELNRMALALE
jgi:hypothetical protein